MRLWRLDRIVSIDLLDRASKRAESFNLEAYAAQSFGVFQEEPIDVVLRFAPEAADDAAVWRFHPTQSIEREPNGALTVRFRAGGMQEMCWHLFTWGTAVTVEAPDVLRTAIAAMAKSTAAHHNTPRDSFVLRTKDCQSTHEADKTKSQNLQTKPRSLNAHTYDVRDIR